MEEINTYKMLVGKSEVKIHRRGWDDDIKCILKYNVRVWTGFRWLRIGSSGGFL
jgi:hypothetical protein